MKKAYRLLPKEIRCKYLWQIVFSSSSAVIELTTLLIVYKFFELLNSHDNSSQKIELNAFTQTFNLSLTTLYLLVFSYLLFGLAIRVINQLRLHGLTKFYRDFFSRDFSWHKTNNSAELVKSVMQDSNLLTSGYFIASVNVISNFIIIIGLVSIFLYINFTVSVCIVAVAIFFYFLLRFFTKKKLTIYGKKKATAAASRYKSISESVKALHEIYIDARLDAYQERFSNFTGTYTSAHRGYSVISSVPTMFVESASLVAVTFFGIFIVDEAVDPESLAQLMFGVVCATRLIPAVNRIFQAKSALTFTSILLEQNTQAKESNDVSPLNTQFKFSDKIHLEEASYSINGERLCPAITSDLRKGERILVKGKSGSGKSTLIELICGLLSPTEGRILIDSKNLGENLVSSWQQQISYLPQRSHIKDASILENIKMGLDDFSQDELDAVVNLLGLNMIPGGVDRSCGEDGVAISGGQRQRIAMARTLLSRKEVIIMDEATNSLDSDGEIELLKKIFQHKGKATFICISHRTDVDQLFDRIINMETS